MSVNDGPQLFVLLFIGVMYYLPIMIQEFLKDESMSHHIIFWVLLGTKAACVKSKIDLMRGSADRAAPPACVFELAVRNLECNR